VLDDVVTHRFDPASAFSNIRSAMKPSDRLLLAVFRPGRDNPWATSVVAAIRHRVPPPPPLGPEDPGQFSWSDPSRIRRILNAAGFHDVVLTRSIYHSILGPMLLKLRIRNLRRSGCTAVARPTR
jgi:hypothetical protein